MNLIGYLRQFFILTTYSSVHRWTTPLSLSLPVPTFAFEHKHSLTPGSSFVMIDGPSLNYASPSARVAFAHMYSLISRELFHHDLLPIDELCLFFHSDLPSFM